ncbi:hypothetical protein D3C78_1169670 [compost metagenome]
MQVHTYHHCPGIAIQHSTDVLSERGLLLPGFVAPIIRFALVPVASGQLTYPSDQYVHGVVEIQVSRPLLIQAGQPCRATLQADVLTGLPEGLQVLVACVCVAVIEKVVHLLDAVEVSGELGRLHSFIARSGLTDLEGGSVGALDGLDESLDQDGDLRLGKVGLGRGIAMGHGMYLAG